jgi:phosphoglycolate phosphatase-like HAD superfamily hydrolase
VEVTAKAPLGTFDAILFDFDGTLGDSHEAVLRAYAQRASLNSTCWRIMGSYLRRLSLSGVLRRLFRVT